LDVPLEDRGGEARTMGDLLGEDDQRFAFVDAAVSIAAAARHLPETERRVIALRFFEDRTQTEIADQIGVSQMQVSRILRRAMTRISRCM
jgi:RNA polymerase sigma-B factor